MNKKPLGLHDSNLIDDDWPEIQQVVARPVRRTLSLLSLILMLAATGGDMAGKSQLRPGSISYRKSYDHTRRANEYADLGMDELAIAEFDQAATLENLAHLKWRRAGQWQLAGMVLFVLAFGCFGLSRCVGERALTFWFFLFSSQYIFLFFLMV
jgi:hypothetical protein